LLPLANEQRLDRHQLAGDLRRHVGPLGVERVVLGQRARRPQPPLLRIAVPAAKHRPKTVGNRQLAFGQRIADDGKRLGVREQQRFEEVIDLALAARNQNQRQPQLLAGAVICLGKSFSYQWLSPPHIFAQLSHDPWNLAYVRLDQ
jgi:hypothetical protein